ncbi:MULTISPECIES: UDP-2,4-diacetamido-2,4,6-trideoxy-beta-L-altropyranose hydrolase [unclassified Arthrobacter]|uniref:UDP-2,4-diacetamido-2,4, 6-trideoxy-beta-L-altropyranose hydrolase n=1 Tax=unclassified Arthrobacter TaxID=235627 RepID=UPI0027D8E343|nr:MULTISPECIES: UDP-2,4-diacetamido-2,4,6-trideoxy-beta-L-altropyranose hydrolase [unclassified Arthrobacter]
MSISVTEVGGIGVSVPHFVAVFRVDASSVIGSGHVMRCLTLAEELRSRGGDCLFVCRTSEGDLVGEIRRRGFSAMPMGTVGTDIVTESVSALDHADWLAGGWQFDVNETLQFLGGVTFDWLVIDHYGIDLQWESEFRAARPTARLACIDDLADRAHECDLLIDQNLGRRTQDYTALVPPTCKSLVGTRYALLRPEFRAVRAESLARRREGLCPERVFVNLGGVDMANMTARVIEALAELPESNKIKVDIVLGGSAPHADSVRRTARKLPLDTTVYVNTARMADLMALADVAVGAGGGTSWERCSLGLPSMVLELAPNQRNVVLALASHDVAYILEDRTLTASVLEAWKKLQDPERLLQMSMNASNLVTGDGAMLVADALLEEVELESSS